VTDSQVLRVSHLGLCVTDLERSLRFYGEGLGFVEVSRLRVAGPPAQTLLELEDMKLTAVFLERDGTRLELLRYDSPETLGSPSTRPMNAAGLTHLSLRVADLERCVADLEALGGRALAATRIEIDQSRTRALFVTDPDGTRIELVEAPGDPAAAPGA
jgi:catechol 2,3-dioxygenase-like lactoylglutathione lyase family enzyme